MKNIIFNNYLAGIILVVGIIAFVFAQAQYVWANLKISAEKGKSIRVAEKNACVLADQQESVHFNGCSSII